jgi:hypothetical protein
LHFDFRETGPDFRQREAGAIKREAAPPAVAAAKLPQFFQPQTQPFLGARQQVEGKGAPVPCRTRAAAMRCAAGMAFSKNSDSAMESNVEPRLFLSRWLMGNGGSNCGQWRLETGASAFAAE